METNRAEHLRKTVTGVCLIAAPVVVLVGQLVHPPDKSDAAEELAVVAGNLDRWYAAHLLELVAFALLIPAVLGLAHLIHERRPGLAYAGGALSLLGIVAVSAIVGVDGLAGYFVAKASPASTGSVAFFEGVFESGLMLPLYVTTLLLGIGFIVLAVGLYRSRVVAPWTATAIGLGALVMDIGFPAGLHTMIVAGMVLLLIGMAPIGYSVLTETDGAWAHTPDFAGFRRPAGTLT